MRKLFIGGNGVNRQIKLPIKAAFLSAAMVALGFTAAAKADTVLGQFTLTNYYTPTSPTDSTPTDPSNPLSATVTFTYLSPSVNGGDNLAVTIANTSTPLSSNELIRDVVFQISDRGTILDDAPAASGAYMPNYAEEYLNGSETRIAPGALTYPWQIVASPSYPSSYDLTSPAAAFEQYQVNADMVGPSYASMGQPGQSINSTHLTVLLPYPPASVTFDVSIPNLDSMAAVQNVYIGYGLTSTLGGYAPLGGYVEIPSSAAAVPEPSIGAALGSMLAVAGLLIRHRRA